jgi:TonB family protein
MSKAKAVSAVASVLMAVSLLATELLSGSPAQAQAKPKDKIIKSSKLVIHSLEAMRYPPAARGAGVQGRVVVQVQLNDAGQVIAAAALPDQDEKMATLAADAAWNARQWRFRYHHYGKAEIIYDFALVGDCAPEETEWRFAFTAPNAVEISDCRPHVWVTAAQKQAAAAEARGVTLVSFEKMAYPPLAATARISGDVLVRADLAADGTVISASAVSGHPMLAAAAVSNLRNWRFQPNPEKQVSVVYAFRLGETICPNGEIKSDFDVEPPNRVTIRGHAYIVEQTVGK